MLSATLPVRPPAYIPLDSATCIAFERTHHTRYTYAVQLQRRNQRPVLLGAIEYNERLAAWYLTHLGRNPIPKAESFPFQGATDAGTYLHEDWQGKQRQALKATLAEA